MAILLLIETATEICSVALSKNGELLALQETDESYAHASQLTLLIERCLTEAGINMEALDAVAVSAGPGSYTGLRIGVSTAKGICYALNKPLIGVNTLLALARASTAEKQLDALYCPMIDARRMEVYAAIFNKQNKILSATNAYILDSNSFSDHFARGKRIVFSGNGSHKCRSVITNPQAVFHPILCSAQHLAPIAEQSFHSSSFADLAYFAPQYFKAPNITISKKIF